MQPSAALAARLKTVRLFLTDVDGVLTDGTVTMGGGVESKTFDIRDGYGLKLLQREGIKVGWISARPSPATTERAVELAVDFLRQSPAPKVEVAAGILAETGLTWGDAAFVGDDLLDLGLLRKAGFSAAPADARPEARSAAHYVCLAPGGRGAVREIVELILRAQGRWEALVAKLAS